MNDELISPPYPGEGCTAELLYKYLGDLRDWVGQYRDDINAAVGKAVVRPSRPLPKKTVFVAQPVPHQFQCWLFLRKLREQWDQIVRMYEDDWDDKYALQARVALVGMACSQLEEVCTPQEVREARTQKYVEKMQRVFEGIAAMFEKAIHEDEDEDAA